MAFCKQNSPSLQPGKHAEESVLCNLGSLPADIQNHLKKEYGSWKVQEPSNLTASAHEIWKSERPLRCPGITMGHFDKAKSSSYAIFLVPKKQNGQGYKFLIFSPISGQPSYGMTTLDESGDAGSGGLFIRTVGVSKFFDEKSKMKFQVQASEIILVVDSAENEYEADVYFLAKGGYRREPVDY